jgi:hypothetical protein
MKHAAFIGFAILTVGWSPAGAAQSTAKPEKIEPVAVVGCLKEAKPNFWMLVNASDPVPSTANAAPAKELAALPKGGKNEFQLIGVSIFNLPAHRDHSVAVKGLPIKATPTNRLNVTSVTMIAANCGQ